MHLTFNKTYNFYQVLRESQKATQSKFLGVESGNEFSENVVEKYKVSYGKRMFLRKAKLCEYFNKNFIMYIKTFTKLCHYGKSKSEKLFLTNDGHFHEHKFEVAF